MYPRSMLTAIINRYHNFSLEIFTAMKNHCVLHGRVFVRGFMSILVEHHKVMTSVREDTHANLLLRYSHMT